MRRHRAVAIALLALATTGCLAEKARDVVQEILRDCSTTGQNRFVADTLDQIYFWYQELPDVDPDDFDSPEAFLEAVRFRPLDASFSYVNFKEEDEAYTSRSEYVGFGFGTTLVAPTELRVTRAYPGSPAAEAGLDRGTEILEVDGRTVADLADSGELDGAFGPSEPGHAATLRFRTRAGEVIEARLVKRVIDIPPVGVTRLVASGGRAVGYVELANFTEPSKAALDTAFRDLRGAGANELVLDLRYNGGGLVSVAQHLAGLVGGARTDGRVLARIVHNDKNRSRDVTLEFPGPGNALGLERLLVITTRGSASASELMINGLRPHVAVTVVGDRTFGKPVGQYSYDFCDRVLHPVSFTVRNAKDEGDYFDGIAADCAAPDDLSYDLGDPAEASFAAALSYLAGGRCDAQAAAAARAQSSRRPPPARQPLNADPWRSVVGAF